MTKKSQESFEHNCVYVEEYLAGERDNPYICVTYAVAKKIMKKYNISLKRKEIVNENNGLCMFMIN